MIVVAASDRGAYLAIHGQLQVAVRSLQDLEKYPLSARHPKRFEVARLPRRRWELHQLPGRSSSCWLPCGES